VFLKKGAFLDYNTFRDRLKNIKLSNKDLTLILKIDKSTPSAYWKKKDEVPTYIEVFIEALETMNPKDRLFFIHSQIEKRTSI
jgi:hypothetical protein